MGMYDFTTKVNRQNQGSLKWELMYKDNPQVSDDVVPLSVADMEFTTIPEVQKALHELIDTYVLGYAGPTNAFYDACIAWQTTVHGWKPQKEWMVLSPGIVPAIYNAVASLTTTDNEIIIQPPVYYPFAMAVERYQRQLITNPLKCSDAGTYEIDFDDLEKKAAHKNARMLILSNPHNPVGRVWTHDELRKIADICLDNNVVIVSDEIHGDIIMHGHKHVSIMNVLNEDELDSVIVCTAPTKTFNLAGIQSSQIYIPNESLRAAFSKAYESAGYGMLSPFAYAATTAAYTSGKPWLEELLVHIQDNYEYLSKRLSSIDERIVISPLEGTYLAWFNLAHWGFTDKELELFMHEKAQLYLDEGYIFSNEGSGYERMNIACPQSVLARALDRLEFALTTEGLLK